MISLIPTCVGKPFDRRSVWCILRRMPCTHLSSPMSLLVVGTVAFDDIETPFISGVDILGGSATYAVLAAHYFVDPVALVAVVGGDFPEAYVDLLRSRGIRTDGLVVQASGKTFAWGGRYRYDLNQRDTLFTDLNVLETFDPVVPEAYQASRIVCLGNLDPITQGCVLDQVDAPDFVVCDTMNYWITHTRERLVAFLGRIDCLLVNDSEARQLAEEPNLLVAARKIQAMGPRFLVIKKGEHGAMLFGSETVFVAPAYPVEDIQDPTGAGDGFMGGFCGYLARSGEQNPRALRRAVIYGSAMASFVVERLGPERLLNLTGHDITTRLKAFRTLSEIPPFDYSP